MVSNSKYKLELGKYLPILSDKFLKNSLLVQKEVVLKDKSKNPNFNVEFEDKLVVLEPIKHAKFHLYVLFLGNPKKFRYLSVCDPCPDITGCPISIRTI